ncbi:hypothetical protein D3C87_1770360 [compost metagenome]
MKVAQRGLAVRHHRAVLRITFGMPVGADDQPPYLRRQSLRHVRHHGFAVQQDQALVLMGHARALPARQDQPGDTCRG